MRGNRRWLQVLNPLLIIAAVTINGLARAAAQR